MSSTDTIEAKRGPGRPRRADLVAGERRRRRAGTIDRMFQFKLDVFDESQLNLRDYVYRWVAEDQVRMLTTSDDYDPVDAGEIAGFDASAFDMAGDGGSQVRKQTGRYENGAPQFSYLLKKPRAFWDADQAEGVRRRTDQLKGRIERGVLGGAGENDRTVEAAYVASGSQLSGVGTQIPAGEARRTGKVN